MDVVWVQKIWHRPENCILLIMPDSNTTSLSNGWEPQRYSRVLETNPQTQDIAYAFAWKVLLLVLQLTSADINIIYTGRKRR